MTGYGSYYNHSPEPNVDWYTNDDEKTFVFESITDIKEGEELFINYSNGVLFDE